MKVSLHVNGQFILESSAIKSLGGAKAWAQKHIPQPEDGLPPVAFIATRRGRVLASYGPAACVPMASWSELEIRSEADPDGGVWKDETPWPGPALEMEDSALGRALGCFAPDTQEAQERAGRAVAGLVDEYRAHLEAQKTLPKKDDATLKPRLRKVRTAAANLAEALQELAANHPEALPILADPAHMEPLMRTLAQVSTEAESRLAKRGKQGEDSEAEDVATLLWKCMAALEREEVEASTNGRTGTVPRLARAVRELATGQAPGGAWASASDKAMPAIRSFAKPFIDAAWGQQGGAMVLALVEALEGVRGLEAKRVQCLRLMDEIPHPARAAAYDRLKRAMVALSGKF